MSAVGAVVAPRGRSYAVVLSDGQELRVTAELAAALVTALLAQGAIHAAWLHGVVDRYTEGASWSPEEEDEARRWNARTRDVLDRHDVSVRLANCAQRQGWDELPLYLASRIPDAQILRAPNMGRVTLAELHAVFFAEGLHGGGR